MNLQASTILVSNFKLGRTLTLLMGSDLHAMVKGFEGSSHANHSQPQMEDWFLLDSVSLITLVRSVKYSSD